LQHDRVVLDDATDAEPLLELLAPLLELLRGQIELLDHRRLFAAATFAFHPNDGACGTFPDSHSTVGVSRVGRDTFGPAR
jgi:hypothetical protein